MAKKDQLRDLDALESLLTELARLLLSAGIPYPQFHAVAQAAFVKAGVERTKLRNARPNQSGIAAITGLTRTSVRAILKTGGARRSADKGPVLSLVFGWTNDPDFVASDGAPKVLPLKARRGSFGHLTKAYGGDVSERALLTELKRLNLIQIDQGMLTLKTSGAENRQTRELRALSIALARSLQQSSKPGSNPSLNVLGGEVSYHTPLPIERILIKKRVRQSLDAFLADVRASTSTTAKSSSRMSKVSVLVIAQD
ncbi:MAG: DUF6502 family protein [Nevskiaceae bacterium]|jgi:hypothetical protein|nr:DUF6502 family protein [Nevskiaceae bacterium]